MTFAGAGLHNLLDRPTVTIAGNVAAATHGETVEEVAGSGDASRPFQAFALRQPPLTYVRAETPSGRASTLEVRVNDVLWHEVRSLYGTGPGDRVYVTRPADEGHTTVHFGDGWTGARLPTGQQNVRFKYRKGGGTDGAVRAGQLTTLLTRPLGVREVTNPLPAEGADAPEALADARRNAPLTVVTLDRVVSLRDYEDFSRAYPGIAKALATWTWDGHTRGVFLTLAGPDGVAVEPGGVVASALAGSVRAAGDPFVPLRVDTYRPAAPTGRPRSYCCSRRGAWTT
jgi:predicted phage baseplate assembly protein